jgi:hypothetical protein
MNKLILFKIGILFLGFILFGCGSDSKKGNESEQEMQVETTNQSDKFGETFYQIPSPEELFAFLQGGKLPFKANLLNPIDKANQYVEVKSKELNFGIYIADLAYSAAFSRYQESLKNIESVRKMSEDIGISSVFDAALTKRIQNIFENADTLLNVTNSSYYKIVTYLEENERNRTLALISTGGWLECLYIFTNLVDKYNPNDPTVQRIADQKLTFENLLEYLKKHQEDINIKSTIEDLEPLKNAFAALEEVKINQASSSGSGNVIVVGGSKKINITESQFQTLKEEIAKIRNKITGK